MQLPPKAIDQFKALCKQKGLDLTEAEMEEQARELIWLMALSKGKKHLLNYL